MADYDKYLIDIDRVQFGTQIKTSEGMKVPINAKLYKDNSLHDIQSIMKYSNSELNEVDKGTISAFASHHNMNNITYDYISRVENRSLGNDLVSNSSAIVDEETLYAIEYDGELYYRYGSELQSFIDDPETSSEVDVWAMGILDMSGLVAAYSTQDSRNTITWDSIDRVEGEVLGEEMVENGDFSDGLTGWWEFSDNQIIEVSDGVLHMLSDGASCYIRQYDKLSTENILYKIIVDIASISGAVYISTLTTPVKVNISNQGVTTYYAYSNLVDIILSRLGSVNVYINSISIKPVLSYSKIIGTASASTHKDISGNGNDISQTTSTMQCSFDSELGEWSWDGVAQEDDVTLDKAVAWAYPADVTFSGANVYLGQSAAGVLAAETFRGMAFFSRIPTTLEQARIEQWYNSLDPVQRQIAYVNASVGNASEWLANTYGGAGTSDSQDSIYAALIATWPELAL